MYNAHPVLTILNIDKENHVMAYAGHCTGVLLEDSWTCKIERIKGVMFEYA